MTQEKREHISEAITLIVIILSMAAGFLILHRQMAIQSNEMATRLITTPADVLAEIVKTNERISATNEQLRSKLIRTPDDVYHKLEEMSSDREILMKIKADLEEVKTRVASEKEN